MQQSHDVTELIQQWQQGDSDALQQFAPFVYDELRRLAQSQMRRENPRHTLQATALVNEAFLKLAGVQIDYASRKHFLNTAAQIMRRVLVDHARTKQRAKRGGKAIDATFDEAVIVSDDNLPAIVELDIALDKLAEINENMALGIQLLYFGGLTYEEAAEQLDLSRSAFYDDLKFAKAWLRRELSNVE